MTQNIPDQNQPSSPKKILAIVGIILLGGVFLQWYLKRTGGPGIGALPQTTAALPPVADQDGSLSGQGAAEKISVRASTSGWQEYKNEKLGFSVKYPGDFTLRGRVDSDVAILEFPLKGTGDQKALVTFSRKMKPRNEGEFASVEEMWANEEGFIASLSGEVKKTRWVEIDKRKFFEAEEDNRLTNYVALHRYIQEGGKTFEVTLTIAGEKFDGEKTEVYNAMVGSFSVK